MDVDSSSGDFAFNYQLDDSVNKALNAVPRKLSQVNGRDLQDDPTKKLLNPAMCIKEGDTMMFRVDSATKNFPQYYKDSILNTNKDFDFGPFQNLYDMIMK